MHQDRGALTQVHGVKVVVLDRDQHGVMTPRVGAWRNSPDSLGGLCSSSDVKGTGGGHPMTAMHVRANVLPDAAPVDLFVAAGRFTFAEQTDATTLCDGGWAVPGLVDAHAHLALHSPAPDGASPIDTVWASARLQASAGVLALREPGGPFYESREVVGDDVPHVTTAGRMLHMPGQYFDVGRPTPPESLVEAAREELERSGAWVKVITDWLDPSRPTGVGATYDPKTIAALVDEVHALGGKVAAHATCLAAVESSLEAGVDSLEHGIGLRLEHLDRVCELGTVLVPTLIIRPGVLEMIGQAAGDDVRANLEREFDGLAEVLREAAGRGVEVLAGTDAGMVPHGLVATEIGLLAHAGLSVEQALAAGSWAARSWLGLPGIEEGAPADLVVFGDDPRQDLEVLSHPVLVMRGGRVLTAQ